MQLIEWVSQFTDNERPVSLLLDSDVVTAQAIAAVNFYAGYARLVAHELLTVTPVIDADTAITVSEWAIIRPLFLLFIEREQAIQLEASRGLGVDVYGRSVSEIASEITQYEMELPHKAFSADIITV